MEVVPLLKVKAGAFVRGPPHDLRPIPVPVVAGDDDPRGFVRSLFGRFGRVAMIDYGGALTIEPNLNLYQRVARGNVLLWLDSFPERLEDVMDLFVGAAERVTVRVDIMSGRELSETLELAEGEIWLGYPYSDHHELDALLKRVPPARLIAQGAVGIVLIDHGAEERGSGPDRDAVRRVADLGVPVFLQGGVRRPEDVAPLREAGYAGVLVGDVLLDAVDGFAAIARKPSATRDLGEAKDPDAPKKEATGFPAEDIRMTSGIAALGGAAAGAGGLRPDDVPDDSG